MSTPDEFRWMPPEQQPQSHAHAWTRVYRLGGHHAHIRELLFSSHQSAPDSWDDDEGWRGTGSQAEYEMAGSLPLCPHCFITRTMYEKETSNGRVDT